MCTKSSLRRKIEEMRATNRILEEELIELRAFRQKFDHKNRKRDGRGRFVK